MTTTGIRIFRLLLSVSIFVVNLTFVSMYEPGCSKPLGLMNGEIQDWQISASSWLMESQAAADDEEHNNVDSCHVKYARIHQPGSRGWCADHKSGHHHWLLVDLGVSSEVGGVIVQGRGDVPEWTTLFTISYSGDAYKWSFMLDVYGNKQMFNGNVDSHHTRTIWFDSPVTTRFVKLHLLEWNHHPCLRLELLGCQACSSIISGPGIGTGLTASTFARWDKKYSCQPEDAHLQTHLGWCSRHNNIHQWLQLELGAPSTITGIITRGRADSGKRQWVTAYTISYSNDTSVWYYYKEINHLNSKTFGGNMDKSTERRHYLNTPFAARYIRIHPLNWFNHISMRAALIGCPIKASGNETIDDCPKQYFRLNKMSPCVENLAYKKEVWSNDKKHVWKDWKYGHVSQAVDGNVQVGLQNCALLDNYYTENPIWMVDLGRKADINGVVILTWQGAGQDKVTTYRDYISSLENITVFISSTPKFDSSSHSHSSGTQAADSQEHHLHTCGSVSRENNALFHPRLTFDCGAKRGRYIYVKPTPVLNRWSRIFSFVLCEVLVY